MSDALCSPQVASGPLADLGYVEEVCYGDIPVDPQLKVCRRRSTSLTLTKDSYDSEEIRSDRMVSDSRHGIRRSGGDVVTEISPGSHADLYEALAGGVWTAIATTPVVAGWLYGPIVGKSAGEVSFTTGATDPITLGLLKGDVVKFEGTGDEQLDDQAFQIVRFGAGTFAARPLSPNYPQDHPGAAIPAGNMLTAPRVEMGNIYRSFTFERAFTDIGSFIQYTGQRMASASFDLPPTGIATSTLTMMGKDALPIASASIDGVDEVILTDTDLGTLEFDAMAGTITATTGDFVAEGIVPSDKVIVAGDGITDEQNRNPRTVIAVTPTVLTVAEAIQTGGPYAGPFTMLKVGLPDYTQASDESVLVAVTGVVVYKEQAVGTVTAATFSIDNQMAGSEVVGKNTVPVNLYGNQCMVTGSLTILFDRGGAGEEMYNDFDKEGDNNAIYLTLASADGGEAVSFVFPRCKINTGSIGDAVAEGLPVTCDFRALKPKQDKPQDGVSQYVIIDTSVTDAVAPFAAASMAPAGGGVSSSVARNKPQTKGGSAKADGGTKAGADPFPHLDIPTTGKETVIVSDKAA